MCARCLFGSHSCVLRMHGYSDHRALRTWGPLEMLGTDVHHATLGIIGTVLVCLTCRIFFKCFAMATAFFFPGIQTAIASNSMQVWEGLANRWRREPGGLI
jgi:hypothetical protein